MMAVLDDENATAAEIRQFDQRRVAMAEIRQFKNYDDRERLSAYSFIHITAVSITPNE